MASSFNVRDAGAYEQLMGRWSKALAPQLIDFAGIAREQKILDVGCGTGSLTFALAGSPSIREIVAIDFSPLFVSAEIQGSHFAKPTPALFPSRTAGSMQRLLCWSFILSRKLTRR
jgi:SAM-dependent methyltransferase